MTPIQILIVLLAALLLIAILIERRNLDRSRKRREFDRQRESEKLSHITHGHRWWKEPEDDLGDH